MPHLKIGVFASGTGSNCKAIFESIKKELLDASIGVVISNVSDAPILDWATEQGIPAKHISSDQFNELDKFHEHLLSTLKKRQINFIVLAGYMKKIGRPILTAYTNRVLNIHPALLPSFGGKGMYGRQVHQAVLEYGAKVTGVTVHLVDAEYDHGPVVLQEPVRVHPNDTVDTLAKRVLDMEHQVYWRALDLFAKNQIEIHGQKVVFTNQKEDRDE